MKCDNCGGEIPHNALVCPYCGSEAQEREKIYIDRPVMAYDSEPEPDGLEYRNARERIYKFAAFCFMTALLAVVFGLLAIFYKNLLPVIPQILLTLFSLGFALLAFSIGKRNRVKITPFFWVALFADFLSLLLAVIFFMKQ